MGIELEFEGMKLGCKAEPFRGTAFLYYSTNELFGAKLDKLIEDLNIWIFKIPEGEVKFSDAQVNLDQTLFALILKYQDIIDLTDEQKIEIVETVSEAFSILLNQRIEDLNKVG